MAVTSRRPEQPGLLADDIRRVRPYPRRGLSPATPDRAGASFLDGRPAVVRDVTGTSPAITAASAVAQPEWTIRWAERENDRRRCAYDAEVAAWRRHHDHLVRLRIEAAGFLGCTRPRAGLPVELDGDEVVYRVLPVADLVEADARHGTGLPVPGPTVVTDDVAGRALPRGVRCVATGMAVVTNHRVAFASPGGRRREWRYADLVGPAHHPAVPLTLLHATDGRRLAGLRVPAVAAVNFRFYLTLAFAAATGGRAAVVGQLDALLAAHRRARPAPPQPVHPHQAPPGVLPAGRRAALAAAVVAVAFVALSSTVPVSPSRAGGPVPAVSPAPATAPPAPRQPTPGLRVDVALPLTRWYACPPDGPGVDPAAGGDGTRPGPGRMIVESSARSGGATGALDPAAMPPAAVHAVTVATNAATFATVRWIFTSTVSDSCSRAPAPASFLPRTYSEQARSLHM